MKLASRPRRTDSTPDNRHTYLIEALESRTLLTATLTTPIAPVTVAQDSPPEQLDVAPLFTDPTFSGTLVQFQTSLGLVTAELTDQQTPQTVGNFLSYVQSGLYNGTIIHRTVNQTGLKVVQGGGYTPDFMHIPTGPPIGNEASASNTRGTLAMALTGSDPNSATSEFFFNTADNSAALDPQHFTVFGNVLNGLNVLDQINALPTVAVNPTLQSVPVRSATGGTGADNLVTVPSVSVLPTLAFTVATDSALVTPSVNGSTVTLAFAPGMSGFAHVTVTATDLFGTKAVDTFRVKVTAAAARSMDVPIGVPGHRSVNWVEPDRSLGTITLSGPGSGTVHFGGDSLRARGTAVRGSNVLPESITLTGTTAATTLTISGTGGKDRVVDVGDMSVTGALRMVRLRRTDLLGDLAVSGAVPVVNIDLARNGSITLGGGGGDRTQVRFINFADENFSSGAPVTTVRGFSWGNSDSAQESFTTPYVRTAVITGAFQPGMVLSGVGAPGKTLGRFRNFGFIGGRWNVTGPSAPLIIGGAGTDWDATFTSLPYIRTIGFFGGTLNVPSLRFIRVGGTMQQANLNFTAPLAPGAFDLGSLTARGGIFDSVINSAGNLGPINARELQRSQVLAGVGPLPAGQGLPTAASDFTAAATIRSISLSPRGRGAVGFLSSVVAASDLGSLSLGTTRVGNGGVPFGVAAHHIARFSVRDLTHKQTLDFSNLSDPAALAATISARGLKLDDLVIRLL